MPKNHTHYKTQCCPSPVKSIIDFPLRRLGCRSFFLFIYYQRNHPIKLLFLLSIVVLLLQERTQCGVHLIDYLRKVDKRVHRGHLQLCDDAINLIEDKDAPDSLLKHLLQDRISLATEALNHINQDERAICESECGRYLT